MRQPGRMNGATALLGAIAASLPLSACGSLADRGADALSLLVSDLMTSDVTTCDESTSVTDLMGLIIRLRLKGLMGLMGR